ncbi:MAG: dockerin type I repeat-containing protein, partial [Oscillospiraceae bacterium]
GVGMQFINEKPIEIGRQCAVSVSTSDLLLPTRLLPDSKAILGNDPNNGLTFYVDNTNYSTDASFVLQFTEKDGVINPDTKTYGETRRTLKSNFPVYGQNEKGEFTKEFKKANGSIVVPQGYKGFVRIPFKSFQVAWGTPDLNNRVDLNKVNAFFFYKDEDGGKGSFIIDQIGFYGKDVMNVEKPITYGDVNDDGTINTLDALMILKHIAKSSILVDRALIAADYNQDKNVNTLDALKVLKKVAHLE